MFRKAEQIVINAFKEDWEAIPFRPPVGWERKIGYRGNGRFVSIYWCATLYEVMLYDGATRCVGQMKTWHDWFIAHPEIYSQLGDRTFGYIFKPATHALLIDRMKRSAYIAKIGMLAYVPMSTTLIPSRHPP